MFKILTFLLAFLLISGCTLTTQTIEKYEIKGKDEKELMRSIRENGPLDVHSFAATSITISSRTEEISDARGCRFKKVIFKIDALETLPRWVERTGASKRLLDGFEQNIAQAKERGRGHLRIAREATRAAELQLIAIPPQKNCETLKRKSMKLWGELFANYDKVQRAFTASEDRRLAATAK